MTEPPLQYIREVIREREHPSRSAGPRPIDGQHQLHWGLYPLRCTRRSLPDLHEGPCLIFAWGAEKTVRPCVSCGEARSGRIS
jgi:hypothetical protein